MDRILDNPIREFKLYIEDEVERNFAIACAVSAKTGECEIPWIGDSYDFRKPHLWLRHTVVRALAAQFWCSQTNPEMPRLPLRDVDIMRTQINADPAIEQWGYYAEFLREQDWRIPQHFPFEKYCAVRRRAGVD